MATKHTAKSRATAKAKSTARKPSTKKVDAVPSKYRTISATLVVSPCLDAIAFYKKAFGARQISMLQMGPGGPVMHAEVKIGNSIVMLSDEMPLPGRMPHKTPKSAGAVTGGLMVHTANSDAAQKKALAAGATMVTPVSEQFWGDRYGVVEDPFGHTWGFVTHVKDMSNKQMLAALAKLPRS